MNKQTNEQTNEQTNKPDAVDLLENDFDAFFLYLTSGGGIPQIGDTGDCRIGQPPVNRAHTLKTERGPK